MYGGGEYKLPSKHKAGLQVPKGGSSCASCEYLGKDKTSCTNKYFIEWNGGEKLPLPADQFCSDWWESGKLLRKPTSIQNNEG